MIPIIGYGVVVERQTVRLAGHLAHYLLRPFEVKSVGTAGYTVNMLPGSIIPHISVVAAELVRIVIAVHVAAAAPALVANAEVAQLPGLIGTILFSQVRHRRYAVKGHIFDPLVHLPHGAGAYIAVYISVTPQLADELKILVGAKGVVLHHTAPVGVDHLFTILLFADTVRPVVLVGKAAAGPPQHRNAHVFQRRDHIGAHTVHIGNFRVLAYKNAVINAATQMLAEMAVNVLADGGDPLVGIDQILFHNYPRK